MNKLGFMTAYIFLLSFVVLAAKSQEAKMPVQQRAEFEVASVKPSGSARGMIGYQVYPGGRVVMGNSTLELLIEFAFDVQPFQVSGGPAWMRDYQSRYDIEARPPSTSKSSQANPTSRNAPLNQEQREMLQALLMDRFQLQFHRETRQGPVYLLTLGKGALKLTEVKDKGDFEWVGSAHGGGAINGDGLAGKNISMPVLAQRLSRYLKKPTFDQTGLKGFFDFSFEYATEEVRPDVRPDVIPCILTSLEGIGLKLKPSQGPVETIVIDHAEKPSAN
jgi:uncharacterized protein (TIGR03435 family)